MKKNFNLFVAAFMVCVTLFVMSCGTTDKCETVNCNGNGVCVDGTCNCDSGYEGINCTTLSRQKYLGTWAAKEDPCSYNKCGVNSTISCPDYSITITENSTAKNKFIIKELGNYPGANVQIPATLTSSNEFKLDTTNVGTINPVATFYGNGTYVTPNKIIIRYTVKQGCEITSAVDTLK